MLALAFLPEFLRYNAQAHTVQLRAKYDGREILIMISRAALEYLAGTSDLDKDQSFTVVVENKGLFQRAAEVAFARLGPQTSAINVEAYDLKLVHPMIAANAADQEIPSRSTQPKIMTDRLA